jgi:hypothetical protein
MDFFTSRKPLSEVFEKGLGNLENADIIAPYSKENR